MRYDFFRHRRESRRLRGHDYRGVGAYYLTICTYRRQCVLGEVLHGAVRLSETGMIVREEWLRTGEIRTYVTPDEFVVMPNHFHGLLVVRAGDGGQVQQKSFQSPSAGIGAIIRGFKAAVTRRAGDLTDPPPLPLWQSSYHDEVVRTPERLVQIRQYIRDNPKNWHEDEFNPLNDRL